MIESIAYVVKRWRLLLTIFGIQLGLALLIGLQVLQVLDSSIGHSLSLEGLKLHNVHMVINDLINTHGASLSPIVGMMRWLILMYLFVSAFVHGGIWYSMIHENGDDQAFWRGGAKYFGRCLTIGMCTMLIFLVWTALLWGPYISNIRIYMESWQDETLILWLGIGLIVLWSLGCTFLFVYSNAAKIELIQHQRSVLGSLRTGLLVAARKLPKLMPKLLVLGVVLCLLYWIPSSLDDLQIATTTLGICLLFALHQLTVFVKLGVRIAAYRLIQQG